MEFMLAIITGYVIYHIVSEIAHRIRSARINQEWQKIKLTEKTRNMIIDEYIKKRMQ